MLGVQVTPGTRSAAGVCGGWRRAHAVVVATEGLDRATPVGTQQAVDVVLAATWHGHQEDGQDAVSPADVAKGCGMSIEREWAGSLAVPLVVHRLTDDLVGGQLAWYAAPDGHPDDATYMVEAFYERVGDDLDDLCEWVVPEAQGVIDAGLVGTATEQASLAVDLIVADAVGTTADGLTALIVGACDSPGASSQSSVEFGETMRALAQRR